VDGWSLAMIKGEDMDFSFRVIERYRCRIAFQPLALAFHQDRADDESLFKQAYGYGEGLAMMYSQHPEALPWGPAQRARRARMTVRRHLNAALQRLALRLGRADPRQAEFAQYLNRWNREYWRGFDHEWRSIKAAR
jgi:hypothetical protein